MLEGLKVGLLLEGQGGLLCFYFEENGSTGERKVFVF